MKKILYTMMPILLFVETVARANDVALQNRIEELREISNRVKVHLPTQSVDIFLKRGNDYSIPSEKRERYFRYLYSPWTSSNPLEKKQNYMWPWDAYGKAKLYKSKGNVYTQEWKDAVKYNANMSEFGEIKKPGISTKRLNLRNFPTASPGFKDPTGPGEGFPFDYLQNSAVFPNEPIFISHESKDREWVFVTTSYASGWVPKSEVAYINKEMMSKIRNLSKLVFVKENVKIHTKNGPIDWEGRVGMTLPFLEKTEQGFKVLLVFADEHQNAQQAIGFVNKEDVSEEFMEINNKNIKQIADQLIGNPYGWGGLMDGRDCSATTRDYFASFGVFLPRNSAAQAGTGKKIDIDGLGRKEKIKKIIKYGVPFETILFMKGHIMLYIGEVDGVPYILHDMWGLSYSQGGVSRKYVVGRTVITTLTPGSEISDGKKILDRLTKMTIVTK